MPRISQLPLQRLSVVPPRAGNLSLFRLFFAHFLRFGCFHTSIMSVWADSHWLILRAMSNSPLDIETLVQFVLEWFRAGLGNGIRQRLSADNSSNSLRLYTGGCEVIHLSEVRSIFRIGSTSCAATRWMCSQWSRLGCNQTSRTTTFLTVISRLPRAR